MRKGRLLTERQHHLNEFSQSFANTKRWLNGVIKNQKPNENFVVEYLSKFYPKITIEVIFPQIPKKTNWAINFQTERNLALNEYDVKVNRIGVPATLG